MCSVLCAEAKGLSWFFLKERVCKEGRGGGGCWFGENLSACLLHRSYNVYEREDKTIQGLKKAIQGRI